MPPDVIDFEKRRRASGQATLEQEERAAIQTDGHKWISPAERASKLGGRGVRIALDVTTLDESCRGGLLPG
jgi:hypothetical protein